MRRMIPTSALFLILVMLATAVGKEADDSDDPLQFPVDDYIERNVTVNTFWSEPLRVDNELSNGNS